MWAFETEDFKTHLWSIYKRSHGSVYGETVSFPRSQFRAKLVHDFKSSLEGTCLFASNWELMKSSHHKRKLTSLNPFFRRLKNQLETISYHPLNQNNKVTAKSLVCHKPQQYNGSFEQSIYHFCEIIVFVILITVYWLFLTSP